MPVTDVSIIGAGPVGLALAIGLVRHGLSVRLFDKAPAPHREPRAAVIWPRGAEALDDLGVGDAIRRAANQLETVTFHGRGRPLGTARLGRNDSDYPCPLLIEQHVVQGILTACLRGHGVDVEWGLDVVGVRVEAGGAAIALRHGIDGRESVAHSAWVVGCDGAHSRLRDLLAVPFRGGPVPNLQILQINAVARWRHPYESGVGHYFLAPKACLGCFPIGEGAYRFFCYTDDPDPATRAPLSPPAMQALIARVAGTPEIRLERPTWANRARFQTRQATHLRLGRALLAGDAAHVWSSIGGHGMNIGLRGAHNLAWKLAAVHRARAGEALLDTYEHEERGAVASFLRLMRFNAVEHPSRPADLPMREAVLRAGLRSASLSRRLERTLGDLDASQRSSALSGSRPRRLPAFTGLRAGDRIPNGVVLDAHGRSMRLHRLLSYQHWTLLVSTQATASLQAELSDMVGARRGHLALQRVSPCAAHRGGFGPSLFAGGRVVLVRPDRLIGSIVRAGRLADLRGYLDRWCRAAPEPSRVSAEGKSGERGETEGNAALKDEAM